MHSLRTLGNRFPFCSTGPCLGPHQGRAGDMPEDTIDKISPQSLQISADLLLETVRLINQR